MTAIDGAYTVAIVSDVHGNAAALEAVLADLAGRRHDATVVAGDLALFGPRPAEAVAAIRRLGVPTIYGNTDLRLLGDASPTDPMPEATTQVAAWTRERIGDGGIAYLAGLPFEHRITPPGGTSPADDLLVVHATPTDVEAILILERNPVAGWDVTPAAEARRLLGDASARLVLFGHIHYASEGTVDGRSLASVGSVGLPFDGDPRAAYALASWDGSGWRLNHHRVAYDHRAVAAEAGALGMPSAEGIARRLLEARPAPLG